ncbi:MAG: cation diffusion facilitator family transporter [Nitrososphaeraceae archaeon]|nr:cation diffusion facilitator family transporter [Nitrososphaeraceae archaeon]MBV9666611.1 cation diffusion facilitator family transporter [Nitrososphaeraceae archaeon]
MVSGSKKAVYAALAGNLGIAIAKLIAAIITGSTAMLAETLHSFSDTFNQILLLVGIKTSTKTATERHPFGYGKEQFFWSFIVATMIFGISGILSLEQGFNSLLGGKMHYQIENVSISYIILAISAIFEGNALRVALVLSKHSIEARGEKIGITSLFKEFQESKDPSILTVLVEDSAALLGIIIAGLGIFFSSLTGNTTYDAISSLLIGSILMAFAFFLAKENKALLIGESISRRDYKKIVRLIKELPEVNRILSLRTMHFGPQDVLVTIEVNLVDGLDTDKIESVIDTIEQKVKQAIPYVNPSKIYVELEHDRLSDSYRRYRKMRR